MNTVHLLQKAKEGDQKAIEQLCRDTWEPLYRFIYFKVQNREEAEDITQETYVKTLTYWHEQQVPRENFLGFMKTVALNVLRDRWRQKKRRGIPVNFEEINPEETASQDHQKAVAQRMQLEKALTKLSEDQRAVLDLRIIKGYSVAETAKLLGKTEAAQGSFEPVANSALGVAFGGPLEVWWERLRWRQEGLEIEVEGERRVELARQIAADLTLPDTGKNLVNKAQIKVPVDMEIVKADQQQVDRGSSPWQLDPLQVALAFVNLKVTPEGIQGEPKIPFSAFKVAVNNGVQARVEVAGGPIKQVYLERLIRQDETGIWSVVGYDPR